MHIMRLWVVFKYGSGRKCLSIGNSGEKQYTANGKNTYRCFHQSEDLVNKLILKLKKNIQNKNITFYTKFIKQFEIKKPGHVAVTRL